MTKNTMPALELRLSELADPDARGVECEGHSLVVVQWNGMLRVYRNSCPHLGIELNFMPDVFFDMGKEYLHCANHGALFQIEDGQCIYGPCLHEKLQEIPFTIENDSIVVSLDSAG